MVGLGVQFAPPNDTLTPVSASNLNQASIAIGKLAGTETVTRRVKNVDDASATYTATANVPGFDVVVTPSSFTLAPGAEQTFTVKFTLAAGSRAARRLGHRLPDVDRRRHTRSAARSPSSRSRSVPRPRCTATPAPAGPKTSRSRRARMTPLAMSGRRAGRRHADRRHA